MTAKEFDVTKRIIGASRHSVVVKGDKGEKIFVHNRILNAILADPTLQVRVVERPERVSPRTGRMIQPTKWLEAYLPVSL